MKNYTINENKYLICLTSELRKIRVALIQTQ